MRSEGTSLPTLIGCSGLALAATSTGCFAPTVQLMDETTASTSTALADSTGHGTTAESSGSTSLDHVDGSSSGVADSSSSLHGTNDGTDEGTSTGAQANCMQATSFAAPTLVAGLQTDMHEDRAWLSADELIVYLSTNRDDDSPGYDIHAAVRASLGEPFGEPTLLTGSAGEDRRPTLTADGLTLYLASSPVGELEYDLMVATRANLLAEFSELAPVGVVNSEVSDTAPSISPDGTTLWFESQRTGLGDIYRAQRSGDGPFDEPTAVGELNTASAEAAPVPSADGLTIWFSSDRAGGLGNFDVWTATRSSIEDGFGEPEHVPEVSSEAIDWPSWISLDGCRLYLASRRPDDGDYDLWVAERDG